MPDKPQKRGCRRSLRILGILFALAILLPTVALLIYFPGRQTPMALTLATGVGVEGLQQRVDALEEKAIAGEDFTAEEKQFLTNLYTCFHKGALLTVHLRQSSAMMRRYLAKTGEDLETSERIFVKSRPVRKNLAELRERIQTDIENGNTLDDVYRTEEFYMGDPAFFESLVGLYYGHLEARPIQSSNTLIIRWRAECPWEWPTYESLYDEYGEYHAQVFPIPNGRALLFGRERCLWMDDGLGGYLEEQGMAERFLVWAEWEEDVETLDTSVTARR